MAKKELEDFFSNLKKEENQKIEKLFQSTLNICINNDVLEQEIQKLFQKHNYIKSDITIEYENLLILDNIYAKIQNNGYGTAFMQDLMKIVDDYNMCCLLFPIEKNKQQYEKLIKFYERFGFDYLEETAEMFRCEQNPKLQIR